MINRILEIMRNKNLSASKFADIIGVTRSSISHIISERNKPSLELIQKILIAFPDINAEWLITGKIKQNEPIAKPIEDINKNININNESLADDTELNLFTSVNKLNSKKTIDNNLRQITYVNKAKSTTNKTEIQKDEVENQINKIKKIERIVLFYSNTTFKEYTPE